MRSLKVMAGLLVPAAISLAVFGSSAIAQTAKIAPIFKKYEVGSTHNFTNISGKSESPITVSLLKSKWDGPTKGDLVRLTKLTFFEINDDPAYVLIEGVLETSNGFHPAAASAGYAVSPGEGNPKTIQVERSRAITSLQVCTNNQKIKGVRIWGAEFDAQGKLKYDDGIKDEFKRTNCKSDGWQQRVTCPAGQIAVGLRVENSAKVEGDGLTYKGFTGLSLACAPYSLKPNAGTQIDVK